MNLWHDIDRKTPERFNVVVEIPKGSDVKYEIDKETGLICYDRPMHSAVYYPQNYGFVPRTLCADEDALDVLIIMPEPLVPGCLVECRAIGMVDMIDGGDEDTKIMP
jgi:Inorganic pyrophosphatase